MESQIAGCGARIVNHRRDRSRASLLLDIGVHDDAVIAQQFLQRLQGSNSALRILLAVAAAEADAAHHLVVHDDSKSSDVNGEFAVKAPLDTESLVAWKRRPVRHLVEQMSGALVAGGGEGLV